MAPSGPATASPPRAPTNEMWCVTGTGPIAFRAISEAAEIPKPIKALPVRSDIHADSAPTPPPTSSSNSIRLKNGSQAL